MSSARNKISRLVSRPPACCLHAACEMESWYSLYLASVSFARPTGRVAQPTGRVAQPTGRKMGVRRRGRMVCRVFAACDPNRKRLGRLPTRIRFGTHRLILVRSDYGSDYPATVRLFRLFPTEATIARLLCLVLFRYASTRPHGSPARSCRRTIVRSIISNVISLLKTGKSGSPQEWSPRRHGNPAVCDPRPASTTNYQRKSLCRTRVTKKKSTL